MGGPFSYFNVIQELKMSYKHCLGSISIRKGAMVFQQTDEGMLIFH